MGAEASMIARPGDEAGVLTLGEPRLECRRGSRPLVVGLGGTVRAGSSTEKALVCSLRCAEALGAETMLLGGSFLSELPMFDPRPGKMTKVQGALIDAFRNAAGVILASPGYHGSISGVIKNALDTLELTRDDATPYLHGNPVGVIVTADGPQAAGTTLTAFRSVIHSLRGWPTPFGATLMGSAGLFDEVGAPLDSKNGWQLSVVAEQVMEFANMRNPRANVGA